MPTMPTIVELLNKNHPVQVAMDQYLYIPFLGDEHPFTSYFDVHQGYKVLTHCHVSGEIPIFSSLLMGEPSGFWIIFLDANQKFLDEISDTQPLDGYISG